MRLILGLFLLISLLGCNEAPSHRMAFGDSSAVEFNTSVLKEDAALDVQDVQDEDEGDSPLVDPDDGDEAQEVPDNHQEEAQETTQGLLGPDSLAPEPDASVMSLKSSSSGRKIYLSCYGGTPENDAYGRNWCPWYVHDKPLIQAWANQHGLTTSEANADGYRYAFVRWVDVLRDKPNRDLRYGANEAKFPTYVITDQHGCELWHHVGTLPVGYLDSEWSRASRGHTRRRSQGLLDKEEALTHPVDKAPPPAVQTSEVAMSCGPNGCRIVRKRR